MENKIRFAKDFLYLTRHFQITMQRGFVDRTVDAATKLFLSMWELSINEIKQNAEALDEEAETDRLEDILDVGDRFYNHISKN